MPRKRQSAAVVKRKATIWRRKHAEERKAYFKQYYLDNKAKKNEASKEWFRNNKKRHNRARRRHYAKHKFAHKLKEQLGIKMSKAHILAAQVEGKHVVTAHHTPAHHVRGGVGSGSRHQQLEAGRQG